jgi:thiol-disulfide isomerase/thioredoxin
MPVVSRATTVAGLVTVVGLALAAGYLSSRYLGPAPKRVAPAAPVAAGPPAAAAAPSIPDTRPEFSLTDSTGRKRSISEWDGRPLLINFWATWCPPCRREIPLLNALRREYGPRGFEVVGIAVDFRDDVLAYMKSTPIDYPMLIGEQDGIDVAAAFGITDLYYPFTVFTDRRGRIVTVKIGELHQAEANSILSTVSAVDAGWLDIDAARVRIRADLNAIAQNKG